MVSRPVVIDLGDDWSLPVDRPRRRTGPNPRWSVLLGVVLALLAGGAAAPREATPHRPVWSVTGIPRFASVGPAANATVATGRNGMVVSRRPEAPYQWIQQPAVISGYLAVLPDQGVLLSLIFAVLQPNGRAVAGPTLEVRDLRTGRVRWTAPATWVRPDPARSLLLVAEASTDASGVALRVLDARTGAVRWSLALDSSRQAFLPRPTAGGGADPVIVGTDGTVQVLDEVTGALLGSGRLPGFGALAGAPGLTLSIAGDLLLVTIDQGCRLGGPGLPARQLHGGLDRAERHPADRAARLRAGAVRARRPLHRAHRSGPADRGGALVHRLGVRLAAARRRAAGLRSC